MRFMATRRIYNSKKSSDIMEMNAPYYNAIETTEVVFEEEGVITYVDSLGHIEFFDMENVSLGYVDVPVSKDPSEMGHTAQYGDMHCYVEENKVYFKLPIYGWDDSYPHCDGESDRWSRYVAGWFRVVFDCDTKKISILDRA